MTKTKGTIAIDFDGVIHLYSKGWHDGTIYDQPADGAFDAIKTLMDAGYTVYVHSTRSPRQIREWLDGYLWQYECQIVPFWSKFWNKRGVLGISKRKLPALVYVDDRAVLFNSLDGGWVRVLNDLGIKEIRGETR